MQTFSHGGFELAYIDEGEGEPILLIHGFASNHYVNWVAPGWVKTLRDAGYRVIALDNRGHGRSSTSHSPEDYRPGLMAADAGALLEHLSIDRAHIMGFSMGARIAAFFALIFPERVQSLIIGGLGSGMYEGVGDWNPIADALLTDNPDEIASPKAKTFRTFADQTRSDRLALAACISTSRELLSRENLARISAPTLVAVGTRDDIAGSPQPLAELIPAGECFVIEGRDHMLSVGDKTFKQRTLEFLSHHAMNTAMI